MIDLNGVPMVVRTASRAQMAKTVERVVVATEDQRIVDACAQYGIEAIMTSANHPTGTDRVVEASRILGVQDIVNVQGDEPLIEPEVIDAVVLGLASDDVAQVSNAACPLATGAEDNPNVAKAVWDQNDRLMFITRLPLPFSWGSPFDRFRHMGLYAFQGDALERYAAREQGPLELAERIEMFRYLEYGDPVTLVRVPPSPPAVDTPDDVEKIQAHVMEHGGWSHYTVVSE